jgi:hypothetical protein
MTAALDPAAVRLVEDHLSRLAASLGRRDTVTDDVLDELRDCLLTATEARVAGGAAPVAAARSALRDYGDLTQVAPTVIADVVASRARATALLILRAGPIAAAIWAAAIMTTSAVATPSPWRAAMVWLGPAVVLTAACALTAYGAASGLGALRCHMPRAAAITATAASAASAVTDLAAVAFITVLAVTGTGGRWPMMLAAAVVSGVRVLVIGRRAVLLWSPPSNRAAA